MMSRKLSLTAILLLAAVPFANADSNYPERPIRLIVPYAAGGSTDVLGRLFAEKLTHKTGQSVVVENRPGASTNIGGAAVVAADGDGYTLLLSSGSLVSNQIFGPEPSFNPETQLKAIAMIARLPYIVTAREDAPFKDISSLVGYGKSRPGQQLTLGTGQLNSAAAMLQNSLDLPMVHVGYKGGNPALTDLAAKQIDLGLTVIAVAMPLLESQKIKALGIGGDTRMPALPNVPTLAEQGYDFPSTPWMGLHAPTQLPDDIRGYLEKTAKAIVEDSDFKTKLEKIGLIATYSSSAELQKVMAEDLIAWKDTKSKMKE